MVVNHVDRMEDYVRYLQQHPQEVETLFRELLIGVTSFFRDPEAFAVLEHQAIPQLFEARRPDQPIRVWVPGCSTGEEAYSIAMLVKEQMSINRQDYDIQIFATDIDSQAIETARTGVYPLGAAFRPRRHHLPDQLTDPGGGGVCHAERYQRPALFQDGFDQLPQPADLPGRSVTEEGGILVSLRLEARRFSLPGYV
jgi:two-component system CheB/CheR fusion protein